MVTAFHAAGIKVFIDVVYNHTAESGLFGGDPDSAVLLSLRGLDNATYYELAEDPRFFVDNTEVGANVDVTQAATRQLILDSLTYAHQTLGVDGFRFDLASVLGNTCSKECFAFDADDESGLVRTIAAELPARPRGGGQGVDLIAEPWAIGPGTYQLGSFGTGWAEWNDLFRDALRRDQNAYGTESVTPGVLAQRISGSPDVFGDDGRGSDASINYIVSHDGFSLHDLYACETRDNDQGWPYGPSAGGSEVNYSSAWGGNTSAQHRAARSGLTLLMMSAGVPMMTGGDEMLRNVACNNNAYNVDSVGTWLDWSGLERRSEFFTFVRRLLQFRRSHPVLWSEDSFYAHATWLDHDALELDDAYLNSPDLHFLAFRLDATSIPDETIKSLYVAYNGWTGDIATTLPLAAPGASWYRVLDTASEAPNPGIFEPGREPLHRGGNYPVAPAAVAVFIER
jgi:glycogen operon protein